MLIVSLSAIFISQLLNGRAFAVGNASDSDIWYIGKGAKENMFLTYKIQDGNSTTSYFLTIYFEKNIGGNWTTQFIASYDNGSRTANQTFGLSDFDMGEHRNVNVSKDMQQAMDGYYSGVDYIWTFSIKPGHSLTTLNETWHEASFPPCDTCTGPKTSQIGTITLPAGTFNATLVSYGNLVNVWINKDLPYPVKGETHEGPTRETMFTPHIFELEQVGTGPPLPSSVPEFPFGLSVLVTSIVFVGILGYIERRHPNPTDN